ncbi:DUF5009 domain-containing protein [Lentisphaerota bacterium WC36G]|nr:DUF5009 domain-containing protein [Lentisphaerae bacterium WC36]
MKENLTKGLIGEKTVKAERLQSLDVLRGFDMFWIIGGDKILREFIKWSNCPWLNKNVMPHTHHEAWHGFKAYDLIFPLFIFITGVTLPFVFEKLLQKNESKTKIILKIIRRSLLLVLLGLIYNGMMQFHFSELRIPSVLGLIGMAYGVGALIVLNFSIKRQLIIAVSMLVGFYFVMCFIPGTDLTATNTVASYVDRFLLSGHLYHNGWDPEGVLYIAPASVLVIFGALTGSFLKKKDFTGYRKSGILALAGLSFIIIAWAWNKLFPINKQLWSSSFIVLTAGISAMLMALFYLVIDVWKFRKMFFPFVLIGSNSIFIYMAYKAINFSHTSDFLFSGVINMFPKSFGGVLIALSVVVTEVLLLWFLYRKKIFFKV